MINIPSFSAIAAKLSGWALTLLLALLLLLLTAVLAYRMGGEHATNAAAANQLTEERAVFEAFRASLRRNQALSAELAKERKRSKIIYRTIKEKVPHVVTHYIERPGAAPEPLPDCPYTAGFLGVWNQALTGDSSGAAGGAAGAAAAADSADALLRAGITSRDILENHIDNAEQCADIRRQLETLVRFHRRGKAD